VASASTNPAAIFTSPAALGCVPSQVSLTGTKSFGGQQRPEDEAQPGVGRPGVRDEAAEAGFGTGGVADSEAEVVDAEQHEQVVRIPADRVTGRTVAGREHTRHRVSSQGW
jgi:hypothetical protein